MRKIGHAASDRGIVAHAPCRADLAGGTIDLWPLYLFHPDALTLNFAVNILTTCRITPLKGKRIHLRSLDTRREEQFPSFEALAYGPPIPPSAGRAPAAILRTQRGGAD